MVTKACTKRPWPLFQITRSSIIGEEQRIQSTCKTILNSGTKFLGSSLFWRPQRWTQRTTPHCTRLSILLVELLWMLVQTSPSQLWQSQPAAAWARTRVLQSVIAWLLRQGWQLAARLWTALWITPCLTWLQTWAKLRPNQCAITTTWLRRGHRGRNKSFAEWCFRCRYDVHL